MKRGRALRSGFSLLEVLVAAAVMGISLTALVGFFFFAQNLTDMTDDGSTANNLARKQVETIRALGFKFAPEGTLTAYVNRSGGNAASTQQGDSYFRIDTVIASDRLAYNASTNTYSVADLALRTVTVRVTRLADNRQFANLGTYLCRSGV